MTSNEAPILIVFDCDGTLIDSQRAIVEAMRVAFKAMELTPPPAEHVRRVVGLNLDAAISTLMLSETGEVTNDAGGDGERLSVGVEAYKQAFLAMRLRPDHDEPLYPGTKEVLSRLDRSGRLLGVATGKARRGLDATLQRHEMTSLFVTLQTPDTNPGKPHPAMLRNAMADVGGEPGRTVMVGDTTYDMEMARAAGVGAVGVSWGYHAPEELMAAGAYVVIDRYEQLPGVLDAAMGAA